MLNTMQDMKDEKTGSNKAKENSNASSSSLISTSYNPCSPPRVSQDEKALHEDKKIKNVKIEEELDKYISMCVLKHETVGKGSDYISSMLGPTDGTDGYPSAEESTRVKNMSENSAKYSATADYKSKRTNGDEKNFPKWPFPNDGTYTITYKSRTYGSDLCVDYTEGSGDHKWMEECDRNYVRQLALDMPQNLDEQEQKSFFLYIEKIKTTIEDVKAIPKDMGYVSFLSEKPTKAIETIKSLVLLVLKVPSVITTLGVFDILLKLIDLQYHEKIRLEAAASLTQLHYSGSVNIAEKLRQTEIQENIKKLSLNYGSVCVAAIKKLVALNAVEAFNALLSLLEIHDDEKICSYAPKPKEIRSEAYLALTQLHYSGPVDIAEKLRQTEIQSTVRLIRKKIELEYDYGNNDDEINSYLSDLTKLKATDTLIGLLDPSDFLCIKWTPSCTSVSIRAEYELKTMGFNGSVDIAKKVNKAKLQRCCYYLRCLWDQCNDCPESIRRFYNLTDSVVEINSIEACDVLLPFLKFRTDKIRSRALNVLKKLHYAGSVDIDMICKKVEKYYRVKDAIDKLDRARNLREVMKEIEFLRDSGSTKAVSYILSLIDSTAKLYVGCTCCGIFCCTDNSVKKEIAKAKEAINYIENNAADIDSIMVVVKPKTTNLKIDEKKKEPKIPPQYLKENRKFASTESKATLLEMTACNSSVSNCSSLSQANTATSSLANSGSSSSM